MIFASYTAKTMNHPYKIRDYDSVFSKRIIPANRYYIEQGTKMVVDADHLVTSIRELCEKAKKIAAVIGGDIALDGYLHYDDESDDAMLFCIKVTKGQVSYEVGK